MRRVLVVLAMSSVLASIAVTPASAKAREVVTKTTLPEGASFADATRVARAVAGAGCRKYKAATSARVLRESGFAQRP